DRLKDAGAAVKAIASSDLIPNAVELLDGAAVGGAGLAAGAPGPPAAALVVGFDGVREQVDWQRAELARLTGPLGSRDVRQLDAAAWPRLGPAARGAFATPAAVMTLVVLPTQVADIMEQGAGIARGRGLQSAWAAHAGVGVMRAALGSDPAPTDPGAIAAVLTDWREIVHAGGGHANLESAPLAVKSQVPVWDDPGASGRLIEAAKAEIERDRPGTPGRRLFRWLNFGLLLGHPSLLGLAASGARFYQASGLQRLVRKTGLVRLLPGTLPAWEALLPPVPAKAERAAPPPLTPAEGPRRARVALLTGCVQSVIFGAHNR